MSQKKVLYEGNGMSNREQLSSADRSNECIQFFDNPEYNYQFYDEYKKLFETTISLSTQLKTLVQRKQQAWQKLSQLQKRAEDFRDDIRGEPPERKKRSRRTADQIERQFKCQNQRCNKSYGTEGSLLQHIKLKHPEIYEEVKKKRTIKSGQQSQCSNSQDNQDHKN